MLDRLLRAMHIDPLQWRTLVVTSLRVDLRMVPAVTLSRAGSTTGVRTLAGYVSSLALMSLFLMLLVIVARDRFFAFTIFFSFVIFSIGSSLLMEFQSIVLSPDDHRQLAYQPIDSRTFFAARLTAVLIYVGLTAASLGTLPIVATIFARSGGPSVALGALLALIVASLTTTFLAIGAYVLLLRYVSTARLKRALTYLQLGATFFVYGSYFILPQVLGDRMAYADVLDRDGWILAIPGAWFASYADVAAGTATLPQIALAVGTLILCAISVRITGGRLSLDYADRLSLLTSDTAQTADAARARLRAGWLFRDGERRAIALLVRGLFRHDMKFRLGVLSILPLTLIYLFAGSGPRGVTDPFVSAPDRHPQLVYFAILFFPSMLRQALSKSDAFRAAWILYATPADSARLVLGMKDLVLLMFVLPYLAFVGLVIGWWFTRIDHLIVLLITLALLTHVMVVLELWISPQLPFSQPATRGSRTRDMILLVMVVSVFASFLPLLLHLAFKTAARATGTLTGLTMLNAGILALATRRVRRLASAAEFQM